MGQGQEVEWNSEVELDGADCMLLECMFDEGGHDAAIEFVDRY